MLPLSVSIGEGSEDPAEWCPVGKARDAVDANQLIRSARRSDVN